MNRTFAVAVLILDVVAAIIFAAAMTPINEAPPSHIAVLVAMGASAIFAAWSASKEPA